MSRWWGRHTGRSFTQCSELHATTTAHCQWINHQRSNRCIDQFIGPLWSIAGMPRIPQQRLVPTSDVKTMVDADQIIAGQDTAAEEHTIKRCIRIWKEFFVCNCDIHETPMLCGHWRQCVLHAHLILNGRTSQMICQQKETWFQTIL